MWKIFKNLKNVNFGLLQRFYSLKKTLYLKTYFCQPCPTTTRFYTSSVLQTHYHNLTLAVNFIREMKNKLAVVIRKMFTIHL